MADDTTSTQEASEQKEQQTQASYSPTTYADQSWEIIGVLQEQYEFCAMDMPVVSQSAVAVDKMFADYGGNVSEPGPKRWHLPEHLAGHGEDEQKRRLAETEARLVKMSPEEFEAVKAAAFQQGIEEGLSQAATNQVERMSNLENRLATVLKDLSHQVNENLQRIEKETLQLALDISKKIIEQAVEINPEYIVKIIQEALGLAGGAVIKTVKVSAQDLEFIEFAGIRKTLEQFEGNWQFQADETIKAGCIVETSAGDIDFQLDQAWQRVKDLVVKVIR